MSVVGHLTAYRSVLFVEPGLRGLCALVCDQGSASPAKVNMRVDSYRSHSNRVDKHNNRLRYHDNVIP